jgi:hypothetical protein
MSFRGMNPNAEIVSKSQALMVNVSAAKGLQGVLKSNLGASCLPSVLPPLRPPFLPFRRI